MSGEEIVADAFRAFEEWRREYDPDGNLEVLDTIEAYYEWWQKTCR